MKRNVSLLLGTLIGIIAALSFVQTYSSDNREILHILTLPSPLKQHLLELPKDEGSVGSYILKLPSKNLRDDQNAKIRDKCF